MKQILIITVILFTTLAGYSQQTNSLSYDKDAYNQLKSDSRHALTTGIIFSSGGGALIVGGLVTAVVGAAEQQTDIYGDPIPGTENDGLIRTGLIIAGAGIAAELISIPFYVKSHRDRQEARELKFHVNSNSYVVPVSGTRSMSRPQVGLSLSIPL